MTIPSVPLATGVPDHLRGSPPAPWGGFAITMQVVKRETVEAAVLPGATKFDRSVTLRQGGGSLMIELTGLNAADFETLTIGRQLMISAVSL